MRKTSSRKQSIEEELEEKKKKQKLKAEEVPAFAGIKLKKAEVIKREYEDEKMEVVELLSHEFEALPESEYPEETAGIVRVTAESRT